MRTIKKHWGVGFWTTVLILLLGSMLTCDSGGGGGGGGGGGNGTTGITAKASANPSSGQAPLTVSFSGSVSGGKSPLTFNWNFGDGSTSTQQNPSYTYQNEGNYVASFTVEDANSKSDNDSVSVSVSGPNLPAVTASANPTSGLAPLTVNFSCSVSGGTSPYSYSWIFGDGSTSTLQNPSHTYATAGTYTASITVTDASSAQDSDTITITVGSDLVPVVNSVSANPASGMAPLAVSFTCNASGGNPPLAYSWAFGDGGTSSSQNPSHTYTSSGTYTATCTVIDNDLDSDSDSVIITVGTDSTPIITSISASPTSGTAPLIVNFSCSASGGNPPLTYLWQFGDGASSSSATTTHTYTSAGNYTATCIVTDVDGDSDSDFRTISVSANQCPSISLSSPGNGIQTTDADPTLKWSGYDPNGDSLTYVLYIDDDSNPFSGPLNTYATISTSYNPSLTVSSNSSITYYWGVTVSDGICSPVQSSVRSLVLWDSTPDLTLLADAYVDDQSPNWNFGTNAYIRVRKDPSWNFSFVQFSLPPIPSGASVNSATLELSIYNNNGATGLVAWEAADSWTETGITWNNMPSYYSSPQASGSIYSGTKYHFSVASHLQDWVNGTRTNYGFAIFTTSSSCPYINFWSREGDSSLKARCWASISLNDPIN